MLISSLNNTNENETTKSIANKRFIDFSGTVLSSSIIKPFSKSEFIISGFIGLSWFIITFLSILINFGMTILLKNLSFQLKYVIPFICSKQFCGNNKSVFH